uniref:Putative nucleolar and coiled-body phosphoprotein 1 n=1 Tax=Amblyomma triste TaxID=251400 RepID=A0A023G9D4_AMBTT
MQNASMLNGTGDPGSAGKGRKNSPFRRVRPEQVNIDPKLRDNSFEAKAGARGSWGEKAYSVLKNVKGRDFRHEKTKKKRGTYSGGSIDTGVNSIRFDE